MRRSGSTPKEEMLAKLRFAFAACQMPAFFGLHASPSRLTWKDTLSGDSGTLAAFRKPADAMPAAEAAIAELAALRAASQAQQKTAEKRQPPNAAAAAKRKEHAA